MTSLMSQHDYCLSLVKEDVSCMSHATVYLDHQLNCRFFFFFVRSYARVWRGHSRYRAETFNLIETRKLKSKFCDSLDD